MHARAATERGAALRAGFNSDSVNAPATLSQGPFGKTALLDVVEGLERHLGRNVLLRHAQKHARREALWNVAPGPCNGIGVSMRVQRSACCYSMGSHNSLVLKPAGYKASTHNYDQLLIYTPNVRAIPIMSKTLLKVSRRLRPTFVVSPQNGNVKCSHARAKKCLMKRLLVSAGKSGALTAVVTAEKPNQLTSYQRRHTRNHRWHSSLNPK